MKTLGLIAILAASVALAGNAVSVGAVPLTEDNAHWQLTGSNEVGCVRDGLSVYGSNDDATMAWNGATIDLSVYDGYAMYIYYSQATADGGDYCELNFEGVTEYQFPDSAGEWYTVSLDDHLGDTDFNFDFRWVSNASGVDDGFRMTDVQIVGADWGEGTYTNVFTWSSDMGFTHETHDVTGMGVSGLSTLAFTYDTNGNTWLWYWAIDNVELDADGDLHVDEDFESGGWYQDQHGESGMWEIDTDRSGGGMSGNNWQADSDAHASWTYNAETFSPWVSVYGANTVTADFDSNYENLAGLDDAIFGYYTTGGNVVVEDYFDDLNDWDITDDGTNVLETSWGAIKADF